MSSDLLGHITTTTLSLAVAAIILCNIVIKVVYNLYLSPLAKFPVPKSAALSDLWDTYHTIKCDRFNAIHALHEKHGNVVRIGPNHVSVASPKVFHHIYVTKCSSFVKSDFYASIQPGIGPKYAGLFNYVDHQLAMNERRNLKPMFSPVRLKVHETRCGKQLMQLISILQTRKELDLFAYLKYLMLDVIGDLAFDQSFEKLKTGEEHQCVIDFNNAFMLIGLQNTFAPIVPLIPYLPFQALKDASFGLQRVFEYSEQRVKDFLKLPASEKEGTIISGYVDPKTGDLKKGYTAWSVALAGHGFIVAGSEATSITLTYFIWILIKNPEIDQRLRGELATLPKDYSAADLASLTSRLTLRRSMHQRRSFPRRPYAVKPAFLLRNSKRNDEIAPSM